jgi:hypothetical protein
MGIRNIYFLIIWRGLAMLCMKNRREAFDSVSLLDKEKLVTAIESYPFYLRRICNISQD